MDGWVNYWVKYWMNYWGNYSWMSRGGLTLELAWCGGSGGVCPRGCEKCGKNWRAGEGGYYYTLFLTRRGKKGQPVMCHAAGMWREPCLYGSKQPRQQQLHSACALDVAYFHPPACAQLCSSALFGSSIVYMLAHCRMSWSEGVTSDLHLRQCMHPGGCEEP